MLRRIQKIAGWLLLLGAVVGFAHVFWPRTMSGLGKTLGSWLESSTADKEKRRPDSGGKERKSRPASIGPDILTSADAYSRERIRDLLGPLSGKTAPVAPSGRK